MGIVHTCKNIDSNDAKKTEHVSIYKRVSEILDWNPYSLPGPVMAYKNELRDAIVLERNVDVEFCDLTKDEEREAYWDFQAKLQTLELFIRDGAIFGCPHLHNIADWIDKDKNLFKDMISNGFFLYEIELNDAEHYVFKNQVVFKRENIVKKKVLHAHKIMKEFFV